MVIDLIILKIKSFDFDFSLRYDRKINALS